MGPWDWPVTASPMSVTVPHAPRMCRTYAVLEKPKAVGIVAVPMLLMGETEAQKGQVLWTKVALARERCARVAASDQLMLSLPGANSAHNLAHFLLFLVRVVKPANCSSRI